MKPKRKRTLPSGMAHEQDSLGYFIAMAYHKFPERLPDHLKPPYDKTKFAHTRRASIPKAAIQPINPAPLHGNDPGAPGCLPLEA